MSKRLRPASLPWVVLAAASLVAAGCAAIRVGNEQRTYYLKELGSWRYEKGCLDVWPSVLEILGQKGYPLSGRDRQYAGQGTQSALGAFVDQGSETRAVEGGGLAVRTGWQAAAEGASRYEVTGNPGQPTGCVVTFTLVSHGTIDPSDDQREVDWRIQLELMKRIEPASASRIEAGAPKG
jgi:hypothetical protein